jgi:NTE family protein
MTEGKRQTMEELYMHPVATFFKTLLSYLFIILLTACHAHYPVNQSITSVDAIENYSLEKESEESASERSEELLLILTFSGGGTRAAGFSYGILEALADTEIMIDGKRRRLVDEIDVISSVSGGSFTAAYFGLFGDRIFEDFETKFLKFNVQGELFGRMLSPFSWPKLASLFYERSELAADYYDELLFENKTFGDILSSNAPLIAINATDIALGAQFTFHGNQFAPICSDLLSFSISRAVTASSAVPGAFSSVIIDNYGGSCEYEIPDWAALALDGPYATTHRYRHAKNLETYTNSQKYPYIHLLDGGLSDNLGIRLLINVTRSEGNIWNKLKEINLEETRKLAVIVVNSRNEMNTDFTQRNYSIPIIDTVGAASAIPLDEYSFESMEVLRSNIADWQRSITAGRCQENSDHKDSDSNAESVQRSECAAQVYLIEVSFNMLQDEAEREHLLNLPTSFHLESEDVDRLKAAARTVLGESKTFQSLLNDLR